MIPHTTVLTLASSTPLSRALSMRNTPCHVRAAHVRISQECAPCHCLSAAHSCHVRAADITFPSGDPRHEGPHRYSGIAVTRAASSLLRALDGLAHAEHTIDMTNLMGIRWKLSSHQRSPGCILVLCNTFLGRKDPFRPMSVTVIRAMVMPWLIWNLKILQLITPNLDAFLENIVPQKNRVRSQ
jgi:hypothetical protein